MNDPRRSDPPPTPDSAAGTDALSFEVALARLESIVARLEGGDLELEAALAGFEEGVALSRCCAEHLERAERRIEVLVRDGDQWAARPFEGSQESD
jgi:exodeoxyribonuclease VII small subunit